MKMKFTDHTRLFLGISGAIIVVALIMQICGVGLNLGIDFTGGSILEYSVGEDYDIGDVETILASVGYGDAQITKAAPSAASQALQAELNERYLQILYSNPCGFRLTARMTTNYRQLKTIYLQRRTHRLPEWRAFCAWIETLPYSEFITGKTA